MNILCQSQGYAVSDDSPLIFKHEVSSSFQQPREWWWTDFSLENWSWAAAFQIPSVAVEIEQSDFFLRSENESPF